MQFAELPVGESLTLDDGTEAVRRMILRKTDPNTACDAAGRIIPLRPDSPVLPLGNHSLDRAVYFREGSNWRLMMSWREPGRDAAPRWLIVDEDEVAVEPSQSDLRRARNQLASSLHAQGRAHEAVELYDELVAEREEAAVYNNRGAALMTLGQPEAALLDYGRAIELDPSLPQAFSNRGNALTKLGRFGEALLDYDRALHIDGSLAAVYCNRGLTLKMQGDLSSGLGDFDRALDVDPGFSPGYLARGGARALKGDIAGAIEDLERYLELSPAAEQAPHARVALQRLRSAQK